MSYISGNMKGDMKEETVGRSRRPNGSPQIPTRSIRVPNELWSACKSKADKEERTMADVVISLLEAHYAPTKEK